VGLAAIAQTATGVAPTVAAPDAAAAIVRDRDLEIEAAETLADVFEVALVGFHGGVVAPDLDMLRRRAGVHGTIDARAVLLMDAATASISRRSSDIMDFTMIVSSSGAGGSVRDARFGVVDISDASTTDRRQ